MIVHAGHAGAHGAQVLAIDVLLEPDARMAEAAKAANARLRGAYPHGYGLDESHVPHITVVQRFVRAEGLRSLCASLPALADAARPTDWRLRATGLDATAYGELALLSLRIERTPQLVEFQNAVIGAVDPLAERRGDPRGFVPREDGGPINTLTVRDVSSCPGLPASGTGHTSLSASPGWRRPPR